MQAIHGLGYLRSDAHLLCELGHLMLEIEVTERSTMLVARRWQLVQVFCGCIFHSCQAINVLDMLYVYIYTSLSLSIYIYIYICIYI